MRVRSAVLAALLAVTAPGTAHGEDTPPPPTPAKRALAASAAVVPGVLVHGSGSFVLGKKRAAGKLAIAGGIGLAVAVGSLALVAVTGASRRVVAPLAASAVAGGGLFVVSLASDFYSVLAPEGGTGAPFRSTPGYEMRMGILAVHDPHFAHRYLFDSYVDGRLGRFRLSRHVQIAPESTSRRLRVEGAARFFGPVHDTSDEPALSTDGSFLDLEGAVTDHAYHEDGFGMLLGELSMRGRYDLARLDRALDGTFVEGQVGVALTRERYDSGGGDFGSLLLSRYTWGMYVGRPHGRVSRPAGEVALFYDHRRDGYAGGLKPGGIGAGYFGSAGALARVYLDENWGIGADAQAGGALLAGLSVLFRSESGLFW